jgi:hypothetical protein
MSALCNDPARCEVMNLGWGGTRNLIDRMASA